MDPLTGNPADGHAAPLVGATVRGAGTPVAARGAGRFLGRRRNYLVASGYQLRSALVAVLGMVFLAAFSIALFRMLNQENARDLVRRAPVLANGAASGDARSVIYLVAVGILFVTAVFVVEILETHKTAGVIFKITRGLHDIQAGRWGARVMLRKHDNFKDMEESFNAATRALREQVDADLQSLAGIEGQIRVAGREIEDGNRAGAIVILRRAGGELQRLREEKRNLLRTAADMPFGEESG